MQTITSDMTATVWKVLVQPGDLVSEGDVLVILESMKMEIPFETEEAGTVSAVHVGVGDLVEDGGHLVTID